jgi:uncharacterized RDD family membrane protein YckC
VIDKMVISILYVLISVIFNSFSDGDIVATIKLIVLVLLYYTICEFIFGRTIGKMFTKTKVVTEKGLKPDFAQCVQRSLCRLVLLEAFSFIPEYPVGWHDKWSKTRVVRA